jgi:hypothetical protein
VGLLEVVYHVPYEVLDGQHLILNVRDLVFFFLHLEVTLLNLFLQFFSNLLLFLLGLVSKLLVESDF